MANNSAAENDQSSNLNSTKKSTSKAGDNHEEFPGYPHYPAKDDIMNAKGTERVEVDVENFSRANQNSITALPDKSVKTPPADETKPALGDMDDDIKIVPGTDADVTAEDLVLLGEKDADFGRREKLGDDLDVPGSEDDDDNEEIGEEDEENNYYSLGGDAHDNLEEDKG